MRRTAAQSIAFSPTLERVSRPTPAEYCPAAAALTTMRCRPYRRRDPYVRVIQRARSGGVKAVHWRRSVHGLSQRSVVYQRHVSQHRPATAEGSKFDQGRTQGTFQVVEDVFNCLGEYSDATEEECVELRFIKLEGEELVGAFKVPGLRNVANTAPYMPQRHLSRLGRCDPALQSRAAGISRSFRPRTACIYRGAECGAESLPVDPQRTARCPG